MCCYVTGGGAFHNFISAELKCISLPAAALTSRIRFRQRYVTAKYFFLDGKKKIKTLPMVLISLFHLWFKAVSGVQQKHPLPRVFHLRFHLIMEACFHQAGMGKD